MFGSHLSRALQVHMQVVFMSVMLSGQLLWPDSQPTSVGVTDGSFMSEWKSTDVPQCEFWNSSVVFTGGLCSHFALARMAVSVHTAAHDRALQCASHFETDCILSPEIGLSVPAAFVYDLNEGLKMLIAPKIISRCAETQQVLFQHPRLDTKGVPVQLHPHITVEYYDAATRKVFTDNFAGTNAYCVQMLRAAFEDACWANID